MRLRVIPVILALGLDVCSSAAPPDAGSARTNKPVSITAPETPSLGESVDPTTAAERSEPPPQEALRLGTPGPVTMTNLPDRHGNKGEGSKWWEMARVGGALSIVLLIMFGARVLIRRMAGGLTGGRPSGVMNVLGRYPIGRGQALLLLRLGGGRVVLLHQSRQGINALCEIDDADEIAQLVARIDSTAASADRFGTLLRRHVADAAPAAGIGHRGGRDLEGNEVVDLTRRPGSLLKRLAGLRPRRAS